MVEIHGAKLTNALFSASYNESKLISYRTVLSFGLHTEYLAKSNLEKVRIIMRRCVWMLTVESGGIPWNAPQIMGEIMSANKTIAEEYINVLFSYINETEYGFDNFLEDVRLRKGIFYAIMRISENFPEMINQFQVILKQKIETEYEPEIIGYLCYIIANSNLSEFKNFLLLQLMRNEIIEIYLDDKIYNLKISGIATRALEKINLNELRNNSHSRNE